MKLLCPCLISPHQYGILSSPPSRDSQRGLINFSRILQSFSNNILLFPLNNCNERDTDFFLKSQKNSILKELIEHQKNRIESIYSEICKRSPTSSNSVTSIKIQEIEPDLHIIGNSLVSNFKTFLGGMDTFSKRRVIGFLFFHFNILFQINIGFFTDHQN